MGDVFDFVDRQVWTMKKESAELDFEVRQLLKESIDHLTGEQVHQIVDLMRTFTWPQP
jgi:spore coat protein CotF